MRSRIYLFLSVIALVCLGVTITSAQAVGDYRSAATGGWTVTSTWQTWNGSAWVAAATTPDSTQAVAVTILSGHNVTDSTTIGIGSLTIDAGGTLTIICTATAANSSLKIATTAVVTINGTFAVTGLIPAAAPYNVVLQSSSPNTGRIIVNISPGSNSNKPFIPTATWQDGSLLNVTAINSSGWGSGGDQNFYNVTCNWSAGGTFGWGFVTGKVRGEMKILGTGTAASGRLQLFGGSSGSVTIL